MTNAQNPAAQARAVLATIELCAIACEAEDVAPTDDAVGVQQCIAASIRALAAQPPAPAAQEPINTRLPLLPEPAGVVVVGTQALRAFTAEQMAPPAPAVEPVVAENVRQLMLNVAGALRDGERGAGGVSWFPGSAWACALADAVEKAATPPQAPAPDAAALPDLRAAILAIPLPKGWAFPDYAEKIWRDALRTAADLAQGAGATGGEVSRG